VTTSARDTPAAAARSSARDRTTVTWLSDRLVEKGRAAQQRFHEGHLEVGPDEGEHDTWQARAAPDVVHSRPAGNELRHDSAVEQVPSPQPGHLAGTEQPALDAHRRQQVRIVPGSVKGRPEHRDGRGGRGRSRGVKRHGST
jgi:hypothetical protein